MQPYISWTEPSSRVGRFERGPDFAPDERFTASWWERNVNFGPPDHQWRSYGRGGEEVARVLLSLRFTSHSLRPPPPAVLVWSFEVRDDLRLNGERIGTRIVDQLSHEFDGFEIYAGPTETSAAFWERFGWSYCACARCGGDDLIVRIP